MHDDHTSPSARDDGCSDHRAAGAGHSSGLGCSPHITADGRSDGDGRFDGIACIVDRHNGMDDLQLRRYGFEIGHPADWTVVPADEDWTVADADDWLSPAQEAFSDPAQSVRVSAWSIAVDRQKTPETPAGVEAWVRDYCERSGNAPCSRIRDRAVPLCVELRDCHPGLLVPFETDVQAFFTGGIYPDRMVVVAVWRPESHPIVARYGGAQRLLEAFLSTIDVWTKTARDEQIDGLHHVESPTATP